MADCKALLLPAFLFMILAIQGCQTPTSQNDLIHPNLITVIPTSAVKERDVVDSINRHIEAWEDDFRQPIDPITIIVVEHDFKSGEVQSAIGETFGDQITVTRTWDESRENGLPALYHELCHRCHASDTIYTVWGGAQGYGEDEHHQDSRWTAWTDRSLKLGE